MAAPNTTSAAVTLTLTEEERTLLLEFLDQKLRDKQVEVHRTDALDYKEFVQHQEDLLRGLVAKLRQS